MKLKTQYGAHIAGGLVTATLVAFAAGLLFPQGPNRNKYFTQNLHRGCFSGGAFLPADLDSVAGALPDGFSPLDGGIIGASFKGKALLGIAAWSCPPDSAIEGYTFTLLVSLVKPPVKDTAFDSVRLHWYEHARIVDNDELYRSWRSAGLKVAQGRFRYQPFFPEDSIARFSGHVNNHMLFEIETNLNRAVDFPGQTLAFWQANSRRLYYSLFRFEPHYSWLGGLSACDFKFDRVLSPPLGDYGCPNQAVTEVIKHIDFISSVSKWSGKE